MVSSSYFDHSIGGKGKREKTGGKCSKILHQVTKLAERGEVFQNVRTDPTQWNMKHRTH